MSNKKAIDQFINYFINQITSISTIDDNLYQKILYICIIDTVSLARYNRSKNNKKRFFSLINNCSNWTDKNRVSLAQLMLSLNEYYRNNRQDRILYSEVNKRLENFDYNGIVRPEFDPFYDDIIKYAKFKERSLVKWNRYLDLFYCYRNSLVHSFIEPNDPLEMSSDNSTPYYITRSIRSNRKNILLVFPLEFIRNLCNQCLNGLDKYLTQKDISPYKVFKDENIYGDIWINPDRIKNLKKSKLIKYLFFRKIY